VNKEGTIMFILIIVTTLAKAQQQVLGHAKNSNYKNFKEGKTMVQPFWDLIMGFGMSTQYITKYAKNFVNLGLFMFFMKKM
jgi:hypothetical protein